MIRKGCVLLTLALGGLGCLGSGSHVKKEAQQAPPVEMVAAPAPPPPSAITADQVNESNTADIVQAMTKEMDFDASYRPSAAPVMAPTMENTMKP